MKRVHSRNDKGGIELIEEATHLLRNAPAATLATYYTGAVPFVLGFLYFCAEMSRSPFASQHAADASLVLAILFMWMKFWQALFGRRIRSQLMLDRMPHWTFRQYLQVLMSQAIIQPTALFVIPLALIIMLPFGWVYVFYQNVTVLANADSGDTSILFRRSWKQASLWSGQTHKALAIGSLFALAVFLNLAIVSYSIPVLLKMLFGIESIFTKQPLAMLNTTFFTAMAVLTYLCVDPLFKTACALRCFYGEALRSGEDLKAELKSFTVSGQKALSLVLMIWILVGCGMMTAAAQSPAISAEELDHQIDEVIHGSKYAWRMPRTAGLESDAERGVVARFAERVGDMVRSSLRTVVEWTAGVLRKLLPDRTISDLGSASRSMTSTMLLYVLLAGALVALAIVLLRVRRKKMAATTGEVLQAISIQPDVADENVRGDELPEDEWTKLANSLLARGDFRLATRAFYLASLSHLAQRNLIGIAKFKSNRDYEQELRRRAHTMPDLLPAFSDNVSIFERIWYGVHEADHGMVQEFAANVNRIRMT